MKLSGTISTATATTTATVIASITAKTTSTATTAIAYEPTLASTAATTTLDSTANSTLTSDDSTITRYDSLTNSSGIPSWFYGVIAGAVCLLAVVVAVVVVRFIDEIPLMMHRLVQHVSLIIIIIIVHIR